MVQIFAALFFIVALFAAIAVIAVTLQKSGAQILAALRGETAGQALPRHRAPRVQTMRQHPHRQPAPARREPIAA